MKRESADITGIILAGGKSSRMGVDKALADYKGYPMIQYSINLLKKYCNRIVISTSNPSHKFLGFETIEDIYPTTGPIGGLFSCLNQSTTQANICLPCDIPEMKPQIIEHLIELYSGDSCIVPLTPKPEPLVAIYPKQVTPFMLKLIEEKKYRMTGLFELFPVTYINLMDFKIEDAESSFSNINNPVDLKSNNCV